MFLANPRQPCMCKPSETDLSHKCFPLFIHIFYASQAKNLGRRIIACKLVNSILETTQKCSDYICIVSRLKETVLVLVMKKFGFCFLLEGCARKVIVFFHFLDMYINDSHIHVIRQIVSQTLSFLHVYILYTNPQQLKMITQYCLLCAELKAMVFILSHFTYFTIFLLSLGIKKMTKVSLTLSRSVYSQ